MQYVKEQKMNLMPEAVVSREARLSLRRLAEPAAFLFAPDGADKAGVICRKNHFRKPLALVDRSVAEAFLMRDLIVRAKADSVAPKYVITAAGRAYLKRAFAEAAGEGRDNAPSAHAA